MRVKAMVILVPLIALTCFSLACDNEGGSGGCFPTLGDVATFKVLTQVNNYLTAGFTVTVVVNSWPQSDGVTDGNGKVILYSEINGTATVCASKGNYSAKCETMYVYIGKHYNVSFKWYSAPPQEDR